MRLLFQNRDEFQPILDEIHLKIKETVQRLENIDEQKTSLTPEQREDKLVQERKDMEEERKQLMEWKEERKKWQEDDREFALKQREIWKGSL